MALSPCCVPAGILPAFCPHLTADIGSKNVNKRHSDKKWNRYVLFGPLGIGLALPRTAHCPRILLSCFRARTSAPLPAWHHWSTVYERGGGEMRMRMRESLRLRLSHRRRSNIKVPLKNDPPFSETTMRWTSRGDREFGPSCCLLPIVVIGGVMIPVLDPDQESYF